MSMSPDRRRRPQTTSSPGVIRSRLVVRGVVQGVGFRPHVARLAQELGLVGSCRNDATCVVIEVEGPPGVVAEFTTRLESDAPPLARILTVEQEPVCPSGGACFTITGSTVGAGTRTMVPPDAAVCADCLREFADPADRRHRHPFITCTNCGPRFTITLDLPYDRPATTMAGFAMCARCAGEYADPRDRRFHAQPISCHDCGPTLTARSTDPDAGVTHGEEAVAQAIVALRAGSIVAIKGIGGYHLACDATSEPAVAELRRRKHRPDQPFAVMAADLEVLADLVELPDGTTTILASTERPIVLLPRRHPVPGEAGESGDVRVAAAVAPGLDELGVLLPYAPLHHLLFAPRPGGAPGAPPALVMTSGNRSGEPLCYTDSDALHRLGGIADLFLTHDREIAVPCEDSVVAWSGTHGAVPVRRSRGFAPLPVPLPASMRPAVVLAAGAEIKNTFALSRDQMAFVSAHIGDLGTLESRAAYRQATAQMLRFHRAAPDLVVADLHPRYASRAWAEEFAAELGVPLYDVQHHHAHLASLAAEHGRLDEDLLGVVFDGTGYGCDATVWGGEFLHLTAGGLRADRVGHLGTVRLPGGDAGVRNPVRQAALAMLAADVPIAGSVVGDSLTEAELTVLPGLLQSGTGWVATSSVGRLFDVVASLLGVRHRTTYEAQAAIELEAVARGWPGADTAAYDVPLPEVRDGLGPTVLDPVPLLRGLVAGQAKGEPVGSLARGFHVALADAAVRLAASEARARNLRTIGLTGGVFANRLLLSMMTERLAALGFEVLTHSLVPAGDGGLSLGQLVVGLRALSVDEGSG